jgi:hypothetical protein
LATIVNSLFMGCDRTNRLERIEPDTKACYLSPVNRGVLPIQPSRRRRACNTGATILTHCPGIGKVAGKCCGAFPIRVVKVFASGGPASAGAVPINNLVVLGEALPANALPLYTRPPNLGA